MDAADHWKLTTDDLLHPISSTTLKMTVVLSGNYSMHYCLETSYNNKPWMRGECMASHWAVNWREARGVRWCTSWYYSHSNVAHVVGNVFP